MINYTKLTTYIRSNINYTNTVQITNNNDHDMKDNNNDGDNCDINADNNNMSMDDYKGKCAF